MGLGDETKRLLDAKSAGLVLLATAIGRQLESDAKTKAPWTDRTGNTRRAIHGGGESKGRGAVIYLAHGSKVGTYLEEGTGIYGPQKQEIVPKNAKAMRFTMGGNAIFAKSTKGMPKQPIIEPTVARSWGKIEESVRKYWGS